MHVDVKICGLSERTTLEAALDAGATYVGFVFYPPSPRALSPQDAAFLAGIARDRAKIVALTVDAGDALLDDIAVHVAPDMLQFHGSETAESVSDARRRYGVPVMKAIKLAEPGDLALAEVYRDAADMILFDAKPPKGEGLGLPGGNGVSFDWNMLAGRELPLPWMLSGGLDADNIACAMRQSGAHAIDISSGVETKAGVKDPVRIRAFMDAVRNLEGALA